MEERIFKMQRTLNHDETVLIYDESKEYRAEMPLTEPIKKLMGRDYKIYIKGYVDTDGLLHISGKIAPQKW